MNSRSISRFTLIICLFFLWPLLVLAQSDPHDVISYTVYLSGENHTPRIDSPAIGMVTASVHHGVLTLTGSFEGLMGNAIAAHIHRGAVGENGPVEIDLMVVTDEDNQRQGSLSVTHTLTSEQLALLQDGMFYVNVHSEAFPPGELRGQLDGGS